MKTLTEFFDDLKILTEAIRLLCKQELSAMKEHFCKSNLVKAYNRKSFDRTYTYYEYHLNIDNFKIKSNKERYSAIAVRYYDDKDIWTIICEGKGDYYTIEVIDLDDMDSAEEMADFVTLLKMELY